MIRVMIAFEDKSLEMNVHQWFLLQTRSIAYSIPIQAN